MSKVIGPFRHIGIAARLGPRGFEPVRGTRDAVRPKPAPIRRRKPVLNDAAMARAIRAGVSKGFDLAVAKLKAARPPTRTTDSLDGLRDRLSAAADAHRAARFRARP